MNPAATRFLTAAFVALLIVGSVAEALAQNRPRTQRPVQSQRSTPPPTVMDQIYRPDVPLEQQHWYDRNAIGLGAGA